jgi:predicted permease
MLEVVLLVAFGALGLWLQRRDGARAERARVRLWQANWVVLLPLAATYALLSIELDADLLAVVGCALAAWWLTVLVAGAYAWLVAPSRELRGALWLVGAFPNTGFLGFPLALLAFGTDGLRLAIIYDQVSLVVPAIVVATIIARRHAGTGVGAIPAAGEAPRSLLRDVLASPPLWTVVVLVALRLTLVPDPVELELLGRGVGAVVGPIGFLLLGLSLPLAFEAHDDGVVVRTIGAMCVRMLVAPAAVWLVARSAGVDVPGAIYLVAAMPTAFHALIIARLHEVAPTVVRLGVLATSTVAVVATVVWVLVTGGA